MKSVINKPKIYFGKFSSSHFAKILILASLFLLLMALIFVGKQPYKVKLHEGDISLSDIYAPYDFTYPGKIDEPKTRALQDKALESFLQVYDIQPQYWDERRRTLSEFFKELSSVKELKDMDDNRRIEKLKKQIDVGLENSTLLSFLQEDTGSFEEKSLNVLNKLSSKIISDKDTVGRISESQKEEIVVRDEQLDVEAKIPFSDLYTHDALKPIIEKELISEGARSEKLRSSLTNLLLSILPPNLSYNQSETEARRRSLLEKTPPVYTQTLVKKDELIIAKGQKVGRKHLVQLAQLTKKDTGRAKISYSGGIIILLIVFIVMVPVYLKTYRRRIFDETKNLYLLSIIIFFTIFMAKIITVSPLPSYFIPIAVATMLIAILVDVGVSFMLSIMLSIFAAIIAGNKFNVMVALLIGSTAGIYFIRGARRRSHVLKAGLLVGLSKFVAICGIGLLNALEPDVFLKEGYWGIASGIVSAGIVMLLLPVFEFLFKITTDITLLELSDLNHPLLKKMILNAPGTYHHSLVVGNLAEAASDAVGANSLLARVGAYYHDIGKIEKAEYFSENETGQKTAHEKLTPSMSALIIQSHVKDGVELAKKHNLNNNIIDFIVQHHGTSLIYYFYQRALEKIGDENVLKEEAFRYPGPKPQTKETAIVLLADAVEASSRTLNDPTPSRIKGLVQKIINNKFIDNQLDECDLTLNDLNKIAVAFVRILTGIFHTRVEYPSDNKNKGKKKVL
jgi:putative nucleotidyltransferase with HDIG domain